MLVEMTIVVATVFVVLGLRWLEEAEQRQRRLEAPRYSEPTGVPRPRG